MTNNSRLYNSWRKIAPEEAAKERMFNNILSKAHTNLNPEQRVNKKKRINWKRLMPVAVCLIFLLVTAISLLYTNNNSGDFDLTLSDGNVKVTYIDDVPATSSIASSLVWLSEEELFSECEFNTDIFMGTVKSIRNIEINLNGSHNYNAIAEITISEVLRGNSAVGDTVSVLLPCPISSDIWVEDTGVISSIQQGMSGIFMLMKYDETSYYKQGGATLCLLDIAEYGFADGERYAFLETDSGLLFSRDAYPSISNAKTLDQIAQYIRSMIG